MEVIKKTVKFNSLKTGNAFWHAEKLFTKTSGVRADDGNGESVEFTGATMVQVVNKEATEARIAFLAKPLFDGTRESCRNDREFLTLEKAQYEVVRATEALDSMATDMIETMGRIRKNLRRFGAVELDLKARFDFKFAIAPASIAEFNGLNSYGEVQGNGNVDMRIATLLAKREAFVTLADALGYRLSEVR